MAQDFTWQDGERTIRFGRGAVADAPAVHAAAADAHGAVQPHGIALGQGVTGHARHGTEDTR